MMQPIFRIIVVIVSVLTLWMMLRKIRQAKVQIEAAMFWVIVALFLVVISVFPRIADACARLLGIYSTPNFLFLLMIFLLMVKVFSLTLQVSQLECKQKELVQKIALARKDQEELEMRIRDMLDGGMAGEEPREQFEKRGDGAVPRHGLGEGIAKEEGDDR